MQSIDLGDGSTSGFVRLGALMSEGTFHILPHPIVQLLRIIFIFLGVAHAMLYNPIFLVLISTDNSGIHNSFAHGLSLLDLTFTKLLEL